MEAGWKSLSGRTAAGGGKAFSWKSARAPEEPNRLIGENAGAEGSIVFNRVKEQNGAFGYNADTDVYEDLIQAGEIDPTKVTRIALENAASIASLLLQRKR